jgi:hypothetical protein
MDVRNPIVWAVGGLVMITAIVFIAAPYFSSKARLERRRRRSNARVVSKSNRPTVKFSVRTKDRGNKD